MRANKSYQGHQPVDANLAGDHQHFLKNLANAISTGELCLHYQPRYKLLTGRAILLEALVRWQRPDVGLLYPETFITAAEKHGLIYSLDIWVFEQCCKDLVWFREHLNGSIKLAVNISVLSSESVYFSQKLIELCNQYQLSLTDFVIEITASIHGHDIRKVKAFCSTLANFGAEFCLDDFGTGQSPLANLLELPVDNIVIDRSLVNKLIQSQRSETIIKHIVSLASELGIKTVAHGVEHADEFELLKYIGCHQIQGYFMNRPVAREKLAETALSV